MATQTFYETRARHHILDPKTQEQSIDQTKKAVKHTCDCLLGSMATGVLGLASLMALEGLDNARALAYAVASSIARLSTPLRDKGLS